MFYKYINITADNEISFKEEVKEKIVSFLKKNGLNKYGGGSLICLGRSLIIENVLELSPDLTQDKIKVNLLRRRFQVAASLDEFEDFARSLIEFLGELERNFELTYINSNYGFVVRYLSSVVAAIKVVKPTYKDMFVVFEDYYFSVHYSLRNNSVLYFAVMNEDTNPSPTLRFEDDTLHLGASNTMEEVKNSLFDVDILKVLKEIDLRNTFNAANEVAFKSYFIQTLERRPLFRHKKELFNNTIEKLSDMTGVHRLEILATSVLWKDIDIKRKNSEPLSCEVYQVRDVFFSFNESFEELVLFSRSPKDLVASIINNFVTSED